MALFNQLGNSYENASILNSDKNNDILCKNGSLSDNNAKKAL